MFWKKLTPEWLRSSNAASIFVVCSAFTLALVPVLFGRVQRGGSFAYQAFWGSVGVVGAPATILLWVGMWKYWAQVDDAGRWAKRFWFLILLVGLWYGSVLYCYLVYLPQRRRMRGA